MTRIPQSLRNVTAISGTDTLCEVIMVSTATSPSLRGTRSLVKALGAPGLRQKLRPRKRRVPGPRPSPKTLQSPPIECMPISRHTAHGPLGQRGVRCPVHGPVVLLSAEESPGPKTKVKGPTTKGGKGCCTNQPRPSLSTGGRQSTSTGLLFWVAYLPACLHRLQHSGAHN